MLPGILTLFMVVYTLTTLVAKAARDSDVVHGNLHSHLLKSPKLPGFLTLFHVVHTLTSQIASTARDPDVPGGLHSHPQVASTARDPDAVPGSSHSLSLLESPILPEILTFLEVHTLTSHVGMQHCLDCP